MRHDHDEDATTDLRRWLGESTASTVDDSDVHDPSRRWTASRVALVLLVLAPWVVLAALALTGAPTPSRAGGSDRAAGVVDVGAADPTDRSSQPATGGARTRDAAGTPTAAATEAPAGPVDLDPAADPAVAAAVGPTAVRLVRDAVTRAGPRSMALDAAAAETADVLTDDTWAVRVHAVVLRGDRRRWRTARHEIWVAPVGLRDGRMVGLDRPWRVATVDGGIARTSWTPADVDHRVVRGALDDAGIGDDGALVVQQHPALPSVVRVITADARRLWVRLAPTAAVVGHDTGEHAR